MLNRCALIRVSTWEARAVVPAPVEDAFGGSWPRNTGSVVKGRATVLCLGPADWWVVCPEEADSSDALRVLHEGFRGTAFRATDLSCAFARVLIQGDDARALLSKGCSLDLHPQSFPAGRCARTRLAAMAVVIQCHDPAVFECTVSRSHAEHFVAWLEDAAVELEAV